MDYDKLSCEQKDELREEILSLANKTIEGIKHQAHYEVGKMYGYPDCCVQQFCDEFVQGIPVGFKRSYHLEIDQNMWGEEEVGDNGYVPCDECMKKLKVVEKVKKKYPEKDLFAKTRGWMKEFAETGFVEEAPMAAAYFHMEMEEQEGNCKCGCKK